MATQDSIQEAWVGAGDNREPKRGQSTREGWPEIRLPEAPEMGVRTETCSWRGCTLTLTLGLCRNLPLLRSMPLGCLGWERCLLGLDYATELPMGARLCAKMKSSRIELHIVLVQSLSHVWLFETPWTACTGLPCPLASPWAYSNSCPLSQWCHPALSSSVTAFSSHLQSFPASGSFSMSWLFASSGQKHWKFSFSPSNEYSGLISFRIDLFDLLAIQRLSRVFSSPPVWKHQLLVLRLLYGPTLTSIHDYWKNHSFDYTDLDWKSEVSAF